MPKNRVIYKSQAVYAGPDKSADGDSGWRNESGTTYAPTNLKRIQSANYSFDIARTDVNQFGELARIDAVVLESPTVSFDTSWYLCNFFNEDTIGLYVNPASTADGSMQGLLKDVLSTAGVDEKNYYVRVVADGTDVVGYTNSGKSTNDIVGIGNGFLSNWSCEGAVGGFPTANVTIEALNITFTSGNTGYSPCVSTSNGKKNDASNINKTFCITGTAGSDGGSDSNIKVLKPGNIRLTLPSSQGGADLDDVKIQSFNASVDMAREPLQKLGSRFAYAREITFPITATMSVDCLAGDLTDGNLATMINSDPDQEVIVMLDNDDDSTTHHCAVVLKKAKLDSQSFSQGIGDNQTVTLSWSAQVGSAAQNDRGLFLSGSKS